MSDLPKIYGTCPAGCQWETVHKSEFEASASLIRRYPSMLLINGETRQLFQLELGKEYKIFSDKNEDGIFNAHLFLMQFNGAMRTLDYNVEDEYADSIIVRLLEANSEKIVYEIAGIRYKAEGVELKEPIEFYAEYATECFLYNPNATIKGEKGDTGVSVESAYLTPEKNLKMVLSNGTEIDAGYVGVLDEEAVSDIDLLIGEVE